MATKDTKYIGTADTAFTFLHRKYSIVKGQPFTPPEEFIEVPPNDPGQTGIRFQYPQYFQTTDEKTAEKKEEEFPHYMILPLMKG